MFFFSFIVFSRIVLFNVNTGTCGNKANINNLLSKTNCHIPKKKRKSAHSTIWAKFKAFFPPLFKFFKCICVSVCVCVQEYLNCHMVNPVLHAQVALKYRGKKKSCKKKQPA